MAAIDLASQVGRDVLPELGISLNSVRRWERQYPERFNKVPTAEPVKATTSVEPAKASPVEPERPRGEKIGFVEIKTAAPERPAAVDGASMIEVARPDGWTIRVTGAMAKEFAGAVLDKFTL